MAHLPLVRPLPTAIQTRDPAQRRSRVSFTSGSAESSISRSGESSLHFYTSTASSHTSNPPSVPLPKGARPPSPQPSFSHHNATLSHDSTTRQDVQRERGPVPLRRSSTSSFWKFEWRGISKTIKWAVLGDKISERRSSKSAGPSSWRSTPSRSTTGHRSRSHNPHIYGAKHLDGINSNSSPVALSPDVSDSCLNLVYHGERRVAQSDIGHVLDYTSFDHDLTITACHPDEQDGPYHCSHVQSRSSPNVHCARTGRGRSVYDSYSEPQGTVSEVGHATLLHSSSSSSSVFRPTLLPTSRSDVGHGRAAVSSIHPSGMASTSFLPSGHVPFPAHSGHDLWSHRTLNGAQSTRTLSVSAGLLNDSSSTVRRNPRKLRKSIKSFSTQSDSGHGLSLTSLTVNTTPSNPKSLSNKQLPLLGPSSNVSMSAPRPPRKLTKKPSPQLPPIPNFRQSAMNEQAPPVPPKPRSISKSKNDLPLPPLPPPPPPRSTPNHSSDSSMPALTNSSHSTTPEDETDERVPEPLRSHQLAAGRAQRPSFLRTESNRRWTVAVADVPDDLFIEEFERLRRMGLRVGEVLGQKLSQTSLKLSMQTNAVSAVSEKHGEVDMHDAGNHVSVEQIEKRSSAVVEVHITAEDELEWTHARRAIMCCRELVRTERSYQARLQELADAQVSDAVPKLLLQYLPALITASKVLSSHFNEDMSTTGVSRAIILSEPVLQEAFLAWSGVVGEFFGGKRETSMIPRHKRGATLTGLVMTGSHITTEVDEDIHRSKSRQSNEDVYVAPAVGISSGRTRRAMSTHWLLRPAFSQSPSDENHSGEHFLSLRKSFRRDSSNSEEKKKRKPPFRELAILPTQRVTRYALLYKDLLKHTPLTSNSFEMVEKAVRCAETLARKCDRAQGNSAFYQ